MNKLLRFLFDIKKAYSIYNHRLYTDERLEEIKQEFDEFDFSDGRCDKDNCGILGDPLRDIGTAMRLIENYNIDLHIGTCYGDCMAVIKKENWNNPITGRLEGRWTSNERIEDVDSIYAYARTVNEAVCRCLIYARIAGVK